uniref:Uncharacterized protein n=1 Tax=Cacopsylla melanoneura TaxID=428564 RepID=A0A8D9EN24_9HEMI
MFSSNEFEESIEIDKPVKNRSTREKLSTVRSNNEILIRQWKKKEPSLKRWLKASSKPGHEAFCKCCRINLNGNEQTMLNHALSPKHKMNSTKKKKYYDQKFNKEWLTDPHLKSWISAPRSSTKTAFCNKCERHLKGSKTQMYRHSRNPRHIRITQKPQVNDDIVKSALRMSAFVVEHNLPLSIMNHFSSLVKSVASDSDLAQNIHCGPEKTEFFIKNVLAIDRLNDVSNKLASTVFSIIVDESIDMFSNKSIALVVRYYDEETKTVEDSFLTIIDVTDPNSLSQLIIDFFSSLNVPLSNLLGFAADGASPLIGKYSSTQIRLSQINPFLYISSCVHHSFQYCVSDACSKFPGTFEKLCHDMYDYMHYMPQQVAGFDQIWPLFPSEAQDMIKFSNIRWLSLCEVVTKIVDNWDLLISYFNICAANENDSKAHQIIIVLTEPMTKLVFLFLNFFLPTVDDLNLEFQGTKYCHHSLLSTIGDKIKMILKFYMKASYVNETSPSDLNPVDEINFLILENMYFGTRVESMISSLDPSSSYEMILHFKGHCLNFYMEFCSQLLGRFDFKDPVLKYLYMLNPEICKSDLYLSIRPMAMLFPNVIDQDMLPQLESEWFDIKSSSILSGNEEFIPFWNRVFQEKNGDFSPKYPQMTKLVKALLCLPHSSEATKNTFVEIRTNNIKNRNKYDSAMMSSVLLIREKLQGSSAVNFDVSDELLLLAKSSLESLKL